MIRRKVDIEPVKVIAKKNETLCGVSKEIRIMTKSQSPLGNEKGSVVSVTLATPTQ